MGIDLGKYDLDGRFARSPSGWRGPISVGSPATVADELESWMDETGSDGFNLGCAVMPETFTDIVDVLVPELQRRGVYKTDYAPGSYREKLFGRGPRLAASHPGARFAASTTPSTTAGRE